MYLLVIYQEVYLESSSNPVLLDLYPLGVHSGEHGNDREDSDVLRLRAVRARVVPEEHREKANRLPVMQVSVLGQAEADAKKCELAPERVEFCGNKRGGDGNQPAWGSF